MGKILALFLCLAFLSTCARESSTSSTNGSLVMEELSISQIHEAFKSGELNSEKLVKYYLDRISQWDQTSSINSMTFINSDALIQARELDREYQNSGVLRPLHGIPLVVKDNYHTQGMPTTAGSVALKDFIPLKNAFQVQKLIDAGAVVIGKSNMAEWAFSPKHTNSSTAGTTRNPYNLNHVPAGSSGGTAAAVACNFATIGLGTDTGNSIRGPSSHNALVGFRSTLGLTSRQGIIPLYLRNDVGGPMCRSVEDATRVLEIIAGCDSADAITIHSKSLDTRYTQYLDRAALENARIGVLRILSDEEPDEEIGKLFQEAINDMAAQGAVIVDPLIVPGFDSLRQNQWCADFKNDLDNHLSKYLDQSQATTLEEIVALNTATPYAQQRMTYFMENSGRQNSEIPCGDPYHDPLRIAFRQAIESAMDRAQVDVLVYPSWNHPAALISKFEEQYLGDNSQVIAPHTGQPAFTVPMGYTSKDLPAGLQLLGRMFDEPKVIAIAYAYEQHTMHRKPPRGFGFKEPTDE